MIPGDDPIPILLNVIARWVPDLAERHRVDSKEIPAFLPPPLHQIYSLAGNYPVPFTEQWRRPSWIHGLFGPQDRLLPLDQLDLRGDRFTFIHENQGVWSCETLANEDDPPVYSDATAYEHDEPEGTMREVCPSLSHFLTTYCLHEIVLGSNHLLAVDSPVSDPASLLTAKCDPIWVNGWFVYGAPTHSFYLCDNSLFVMDKGGDYWLAYNDERGRDLIAECAETRIPHSRTARL